MKRVTTATVAATTQTRAKLVAPLQVAVLIPCFNEAATISQVVHDFARVLPQARIYVYDNNSTDATIELALVAGAQVCSEPLQGKGNVVRRMFADIEADVYVLVDGDDTYDTASAPALIAHLMRNSLDLVNAARMPTSDKVFRAGHAFGNLGFSQLIAFIFGKTNNRRVVGISRDVASLC